MILLEKHIFALIDDNHHMGGEPEGCQFPLFLDNILPRHLCMQLSGRRLCHAYS